GSARGGRDVEREVVRGARRYVVAEEHPAVRGRRHVAAAGEAAPGDLVEGARVLRAQPVVGARLPRRRAVVAHVEAHRDRPPGGDRRGHAAAGGLDLGVVLRGGVSPGQQEESRKAGDPGPGRDHLSGSFFWVSNLTARRGHDVWRDTLWYHHSPRAAMS